MNGEQRLASLAMIVVTLTGVGLLLAWLSNGELPWWGALSVFGYCMAVLAVLITIAWVITRVGALIPLRTKLYAAAAIWTAMMAGLLALASFVTITLVIG